MQHLRICQDCHMCMTPSLPSPPTQLLHSSHDYHRCHTQLLHRYTELGALVRDVFFPRVYAYITLILRERKGMGITPLPKQLQRPDSTSKSQNSGDDTDIAAAPFSSNPTFLAFQQLNGHSKTTSSRRFVSYITKRTQLVL